MQNCGGCQTQAPVLQPGVSDSLQCHFITARTKPARSLRLINEISNEESPKQGMNRSHARATQSHARPAVIALLQKRVYSREDGVAARKTRAFIVCSAPVVYSVGEEGEYPYVSSFQRA